MININPDQLKCEFVTKHNFGLYWAYCPFHKNKKNKQDKSLIIDSKSESWQCYVCYENGLNIKRLLK
jgi:Zn-finger protein